MTARVTKTPRGLAGFCVLVLASALFLASGISAAFAAETTPTAVQELQRGPLLAFSCTDCHASLAAATTKAALLGIKFSHASHMTYDCTACHSRFPHTPSGTVKPTKASCLNCHGLRHGPQGVIAGGDCSKCHDKPRAQLIPKDHLAADYNGKGHVEPSNTSLRTSCAACHTKDQCDTCHLAKNVTWKPVVEFSYDAGNGCLSCHKTDLPRLAAPVTASMLDSSAHRTTLCGQCHPDFRYDDKAGATVLWKVNAGLACGSADCHPKEQAAWAASVHGTAILTRTNMTAATCGGCHSGHDIERLKTDAAKLRLRLSGQKMCVGACHTHEAAYVSYSDWWHGAAYKAGAADAPACWTCHGAHDTTALKDPKSMTSSEKLPSTCGQAGCHTGSGEKFAESGRTLVHGRNAVNAANPIVSLISGFTGGGK